MRMGSGHYNRKIEHRIPRNAPNYEVSFYVPSIFSIIVYLWYLRYTWVIVGTLKSLEIFSSTIAIKWCSISPHFVAGTQSQTINKYMISLSSGQLSTTNVLPKVLQARINCSSDVDSNVSEIFKQLKCKLFWIMESLAVDKKINYYLLISYFCCNFLKLCKYYRNINYK